MQPVHLFELASQKSAWLAARQALVASNVANANTPGFRAKDLASFSDALAQTQLTLASTNAGHLPIDGIGGASGGDPRTQTENFDVTESGNSVGIEEQMLKAGEVNRDYALTTNIVKSFHMMLMASLKG